VRVTGVEGWLVNETLTPEGAGISQVRSVGIGAEELRFISRPLASNRTLIEFAPYLPALGEKMDAPIKVNSPSGYQADSNTGEWQIKATLTKDVPLKIPAGEFQTVKSTDSRCSPGIPPMPDAWCG
jgi:hypothetical protein